MYRHEKSTFNTVRLGALLDFRRGRRSLDELYVKIRDGPDVPLLPPVALAAMTIPRLPFHYRSSAGSVMRLSESLARMRLDDEVQSQDVTGSVLTVQSQYHGC
jgi:DNA replicative helicase MCM subunit Mcm2 (Cdc46/Mcm family)